MPQNLFKTNLKGRMFPLVEGDEVIGAGREDGEHELALLAARRPAQLFTSPRAPVKAVTVRQCVCVCVCVCVCL